MGERPGTGLVRVSRGALQPSPLELLQVIPEERLWLEGQRSAETRRAYRNDVARFMAFLEISTTDELRQISRAAVIAYRRQLEEEGLKASSVRRKLSALSSLFTHLVDRQVLHENPCREVKRPRVNRREGRTPAFAPGQARKVLDAPDPKTLQGLRDRAILSVGFQAGLRRSSIVTLKVGDFYQDRGYDVLRCLWKGGQEHALGIHPNTSKRIRAYLKASGHGDDLLGPLFRALRPGPHNQELARPIGARMVDYLLRHYTKKAGVEGVFSAHSMRATFITTALENGASLEEAQRAAGHADPGTTKLYDKRGYSPDKSAAFFASY